MMAVLQGDMRPQGGKLPLRQIIKKGSHSYVEVEDLTLIKIP